jgi:hypothetical protein
MKRRYIMIKKIITITTIMALTLGVTSLAYAKGKDDKVVNQSFEVEASTISNQVQNKRNSDMMDISNNDIMDKNGYEDIANEVRNGNYESMDDFMSNITEEDYQKMIDIMRENGYEDMTRMMESIGREAMIEMHNSIGGAESCHGENSSIRNTRNTGNTNRMMNGDL